MSDFRKKEDPRLWCGSVTVVVQSPGKLNFFGDQRTRYITGTTGWREISFRLIGRTILFYAETQLAPWMRRKDSSRLTALSKLSCQTAYAQSRARHLTFPMKIAVEAKPTPRRGREHLLRDWWNKSISQLSQQSCSEFVAPSCRFVSPSRFHKTGSMFIKHGIPGGQSKIFRDFIPRDHRNAMQYIYTFLHWF